MLLKKKKKKESDKSRDWILKISFIFISLRFTLHGRPVVMEGGKRCRVIGSTMMSSRTTNLIERSPENGRRCIMGRLVTLRPFFPSFLRRIEPKIISKMMTTISCVLVRFTKTVEPESLTALCEPPPER